MKKQVANFEIICSKTGWYIVKQVFDDGGKLILNAAQAEAAHAVEWINRYVKQWGFSLGEIAIV